MPKLKVTTENRQWNSRGTGCRLQFRAFRKSGCMHSQITNL